MLVRLVPPAQRGAVILPWMRPRLQSAALLALLTLPLAVGCSSGKSSSSVPAAPPGTGVVAADLNGDWYVTAIERTDGPEPLPFADPLAIPFLSVQLGQRIRIDGGRAVDTFGAPLYATWNPSTPNRYYLNVADDRFWLFDFRFASDASCFTEIAIQAAFGTVDADTLDGTLAVRFFSSCPAPAVVRPSPNGEFRVRLERDLQPARPR